MSLLALALPALTPAQSDPLSPALMPAIDTNPADYPSNIWITGPLVKVLQNSGSPGNVHWAIVYTTRNEFQSFQVHVQASSGGIANLNVTMSDLVNAQTGTHISASSTDIVVYREAYQNVTIKTGTSATFLNTTGHIPDILVPAVDPYYHQTTNAFPFNVAASQNQSVWIDVHTPPAAPSGYYSGTVTVKSGSTVLATMPVIYAVWAWQMPSTASLPSWTQAGYGGFCIQAYGSIGGCSAYPGAGGSSDTGVTYTWIDLAVQMLDNRYSMSGSVNSFPGSGSFTGFDALYAPLFNGTPSHVPGILSGAKLTSFNINLSGSLSSNSGTFQNFKNHFATKGWVTPFYYLCDEPPNGCGSWANLVSNGNLEHTYSSPVVPNLVTTNIIAATSNGALSTIDWMVAAINDLQPIGGPLQNLSTYSTWLAGSPARQFWSYQACGSAGTCGNGTTGNSSFTFPNYDADGTAVANRAMEWMTFMHGQTGGELYYDVDYCDNKSCGYPTSTNNPITSIYAFGGWGDGTLMYPGSSSYVGTTTPIWLPSVRMKMIRDGMQDYEYLLALTKAGQGPFVTTQINSWITNMYTFEFTGAGLTAARQALGTKLHQLTYASVILPPTQLSGTVQ